MTGRARGRARPVLHSSSESELDKPESDPARSERPGSVTTVVCPNHVDLILITIFMKNLSYMVFFRQVFNLVVCYHHHHLF